MKGKENGSWLVAKVVGHLLVATLLSTVDVVL